jgi:protein-disulfide isomerase-like protein with CxxC motif
MNLALFYLYDSHCPWCYASTPLVEAICKAFPNIELHMWHTAYFQGDDNISTDTLEKVKNYSSVEFGQAYVKQLNTPKDSVLIANIMAWVNQKMPQQSLSLLQSLQQAHFVHGYSLDKPEQLKQIKQIKALSIPSKALTTNKLTKAAMADLDNVLEMQEIIGTDAIPALLLAIEDQLILLNHNLYLENPKTIVEAVTIELEKYNSQQ